MGPYEENFIEEKIKEYNLLINENQCGKFRISKSSGDTKGYLYEKDEEFNIEIAELWENDKVIGRIGHKEIEGCYEIIKWARGKVAIVGLGLGYLAQELAKKREVKEVVVYEKNPDIVSLYKENYPEKKKIRIMEVDVLKARRRKFDFFFVDTYGYKLGLNIVDDYIKYNKKHNIQEYSFCGMEHFLLSCSYEEIVWVYVPELWMEMSKDISRELEKSGYMECYKQLHEELVSEVLAAFKVVLNEGEDEDEE